MPATDSTRRFSSRVDNYIRYRPGYPPEVLEMLKTECGLTPNAVIADIASGTGIFSRILLKNGNRVYGVEPNADMRHAGEESLAEYERFTSVSGTAEATTLPSGSVDMVTAAQAAHWFDLKKARMEFARILNPGGWVLLLWNERCLDSNAFLRDYEQLLLTYGADYKDVRHELTTAGIEAFFAPAVCTLRIFSMVQEFDYAGLEGRLLSSSYTPPPGHSNHDPMLRELQRIFDSHQSSGLVAMPYDTRVFYGHLAW